MVPCRDEEAAAARFPLDLYPALESLGVPFELLLVDDGSTDGTGPALERLAAVRKDTVVLRLWPNGGLGAALRAGFEAARGRWVATLDADLTFPPAALKAMLDEAEATGAVLVAGSPFLRRGDLDAVPWSRRLPSLMVNALYRGLFGLNLTAYTPMFRLYRTEFLRSLPLASAGFELSAEIAARAVLAKRPVTEVPAALGTRRTGASKLRPLREAGAHARLIARLLTSRPA